jgi:hypothetical protein
MVVPLAARYAAAAVGVLVVFTAASSVVGTLMLPRSVANWLTRHIDQLVNGAYVLVTITVRDFRRRDRILATHAPALLLAQLAAWLGMFFLGFSLIFWPTVHGGITEAFRLAGPGLWQIGNVQARGAVQETLVDIASVVGIVTITLQIAYLPTLYGEFNRRENAVALLNARAGVPSWGPELLARTHYALGSGVSTIDTLPELYEIWESWAADVGESHTTYLPLVRFRSPKALSSWVTSLLAVLDSAALMLALNPSTAPVVSARLCLRSGFICFQDIARAMGFAIPSDPEPNLGIKITYEEFLDAIARMRQVDVPIERSPEDAWQDFVGWRVNYEQAAFAIAYAIDAVPALWSGPRRRRDWAEIAPLRPPYGRPPEQTGSGPREAPTGRPARRSGHSAGAASAKARRPRQAPTTHPGPANRPPPGEQTPPTSPGPTDPPGPAPGAA